MARPMSLNGGSKQAFPRHVGDGLLDLRALRSQIVSAASVASDTRQSLAVRRRWQAYRELLEHALDVRIELLQRSAESHEQAISGRIGSVCRQYEAHDPSHRQLCAMAQKRIAVATATSDGDVA